MTFWRNYYHLVWATDDRRPLLEPLVEQRLFPYFIAKAAELNTHVYAVNGWVDHVHLLVAIPPRHAVADIVKHLKGASSHDLNRDGGFAGAFAWQRGYGVLTLGETQKPLALAYIRNQKQHHQAQTANPWLERIDVLDDGPVDTGLVMEDVPSGQTRGREVREASVEYTALTAPLPF